MAAHEQSNDTVRRRPTFKASGVFAAQKRLVPVPLVAEQGSHS